VLEAHDRLRPDVCILVDSPGFNLRLGPALKRRGARVFYYIAPQVWAWHAERAAQMAKWVDRLAVVFPFETAIFRDAGVDAHFVGHPLLDSLAPEVSEATLRQELDLPGGARIVGLLPGSRAQEIRQHAGVMLDAGRALARERPDLALVVALPGGHGEAAGLARDPAALALYPRAGTAPPGASGAAGPVAVRVARGRTRAVQAYARCCAVASGTATLETALFGTPLAIVYRVGAINYAIARRVVRLRRIGLPNIVAGEDVVPELIQRDFTSPALAAALAGWLDHPDQHAAARERLGRVRERLGAPGASARAASLVWGLAGR
jgi:lipid-A-disaccharide synthase